MSTRTKGRGCDGKVKSATKDDALDHIARLARQRGAVPGRYQAYRCSHCGSWHIGHRPKPRRRR